MGMDNSIAVMLYNTDFSIYSAANPDTRTALLSNLQNVAQPNNLLSAHTYTLAGIQTNFLSSMQNLQTTYFIDNNSQNLLNMLFADYFELSQPGTAQYGLDPGQIALLIALSTCLWLLLSDPNLNLNISTLNAAYSNTTMPNITLLAQNALSLDNYLKNLAGQFNAISSMAIIQTKLLKDSINIFYSLDPTKSWPLQPALADSRNILNPNTGYILQVLTKLILAAQSQIQTLNEASIIAAQAQIILAQTEMVQLQAQNAGAQAQNAADQAQNSATVSIQLAGSIVGPNLVVQESMVKAQNAAAQAVSGANQAQLQAQYASAQYAAAQAASAQANLGVARANQAAARGQNLDPYLNQIQNAYINTIAALIKAQNYANAAISWQDTAQTSASNAQNYAQTIVTASQHIAQSQNQDSTSNQMMLSTAITAGLAVYQAQLYTKAKSYNNSLTIASRLRNLINTQLQSINSGTPTTDAVVSAIFQVLVSENNMGLNSSAQIALANIVVQHQINYIGTNPTPFQVSLLTGQICNLAAFIGSATNDIVQNAINTINNIISNIQMSQLLNAINNTVSLMGNAPYVTASTYLNKILGSILVIYPALTATQLQMIVQSLANLFYAGYAFAGAGYDGTLTAPVPAAGEWPSSVTSNEMLQSSYLFSTNVHVICSLQLILSLNAAPAPSAPSNPTTNLDLTETVQTLTGHTTAIANTVQTIAKNTGNSNGVQSFFQGLGPLLWIGLGLLLLVVVVFAFLNQNRPPTYY